jgi:hypothetical protein
MRGLALLALLALAGCVQAESMAPRLSDVPRDGRGEPILAAPNVAPGAAPGAATVKPESCAHRRRCP